jgi:hypothetical protein
MCVLPDKPWFNDKSTNDAIIAGDDKMMSLKKGANISWVAKHRLAATFSVGTGLVKLK